MRRKYTDTEIRNKLSANEVRSLVQDFVEAYENGWRPSVRSVGLHREFYEKCTELLTEELELFS